MIHHGPNQSRWQRIDAHRLGKILETATQPLSRADKGWEEVSGLGIVVRERVWSNGRQAYRWALYRYRDRNAKATLTGHYATREDAIKVATVRLGFASWIA